jgi:hypothetical protein
MPRARIPPEANIYLELGTARPTEVKFEARRNFSSCWVVTDGKRSWQYLWINRRSTGLYVANTLPGGFHESYHADGAHHWKDWDKEKIPLRPGPPLDTFTGWMALGSTSATISSEALDTFAEFKQEEADQVIYLDNRTLGPHIHTMIYLVEPYRHAEVPLWIDRPFFLYLVTQTVPWLMITIADQSAAVAE